MSLLNIIFQSIAVVQLSVRFLQVYKADDTEWKTRHISLVIEGLALVKYSNIMTLGNHLYMLLEKLLPISS